MSLVAALPQVIGQFLIHTGQRARRIPLMSAISEAMSLAGVYDESGCDVPSRQRSDDHVAAVRFAEDADRGV